MSLEPFGTFGTVGTRGCALVKRVAILGSTGSIGTSALDVARTHPDRVLRKFADETGGGYFELKKTDELAPTFTRVAQELHSQYTLGFTPTVLDGKEHKLELKMKAQGMTGRARKSYIASPDRLR